MTYFNRILKAFACLGILLFATNSFAVAPTDISITATSIDENVAGGSTIGTLSNTDPDGGSSFSYSLVAGTGDTDNGSFSISGTDLDIISSPDHETQDSYAIRIEVADGDGGTFEEQFTILINDLNETSTDIGLSASSIDENSAAGSTVGTLSNNDPDDGNTFTYSLVAGAGDTDNGSFSISGTDLDITPSPNYESKSSYAIRLRVDDGLGGTYEEQFTISINNVNEVTSTLSLSALSIDENSAANSTIGSLSNNDPDGGETYTYTLVAGTGDTDNGSFVISGTDLNISASANHEAQDTYNVRIQVNDGNGGIYAQAFTISINDVQEVATDITLSATDIDENQGLNATVGTLGNNDQDDGETYTYSLVAGTGSTDNADFTVSGTNLILKIDADYETKNAYNIRLKVSDGNGGEYEKQFSIDINDVQEVSTDISLSTAAIDENSAAGSTVGTLSNNDPDGGETYTYTLVAGTGDTDNADFTISGTNLEINGSPDHETKSSCSVRIQVSDGNGGIFQEVFTITINDLNEDPTDIALSSTSIIENSASGSSVGNFSTTDEDDGDSHTYTLVNGTGDTDNTDFTIVGSQLRTNTTLDFETKTTYSIRVESEDASGGTYIEVFTISVTNENEAPSDLAISTSTIAESATSGTTVGTLSSTDEDAADTHTYTLVAGAGDTDNASFAISGSDLNTATTFDYESKSSYTIRIRSTDAGTETYEEVVVITISDVNEAPTDIALSSNTISESASSGSTIGTLSTTDEDAGDTHVYSLVAGAGDTDNGSFSISGTGLLTATTLDYETKSSYDVRVRTTDANSNTFEESFTITVTDANDTPTDILLSSNDINENSATGTVVGNFSSTDQDAGDVHTYSLVNGAGDTDNAFFTIVGSQLRSNTTLDFESVASYSIRVQTEDASSSTYTEQFTINVNDINDAPTDLSISANSITENQSANTFIGRLSSTDEDGGDTHSYSLIAGTGDTDNANFSISNDTLYSATSLNYETQSTHSIRIETEDANGDTYEEIFSITVTDANEAPTDISLSSSTIGENTTSGSAAATISTSDEDASDSHTYSLVAGTGDTDNASFSISESNLITAVTFDYETQSSYNIRLQSDDGNGNQFEKAFTITISDENDAPTDIAISADSIAENSSIGTAVGNFSSTDQDAGDVHTYTLVNGTGDTDNASFEIIGSQLRSKIALDHESDTLYSIRVTTNDGSATYTEIFNVIVKDINEAPTDISSSNDNFDESVTIGTFVSKLSATDEDENESTTYSFVSGAGSTDNASFTISNDSVFTAVTFDYETKASYSVRIRATDQGSSTYDEAFTFNVNDLNEAPTDIALSNTTTAENVAIGTEIGVLSETDEDSGDTHTYSLVAGTGDTDNVTFAISSGKLVTAGTINYENKSSYSVRIQAEDAGGASYQEVFVITATDVNESPTDIALTSTSIDENVAGGTTLGTLSTVDEDLSDTYSYTLVDVPGNNNENFFIVSNELKTTTTFNFEDQNTYYIYIKSTDAAGENTTKLFIITINDINDDPTDILLSYDQVDENEASGTTVGTLSTSDEDPGDTYSYSLVAGFGDNTNFVISNDSLKTAAIFDYETETSYDVMVRTDDGSGGILDKIFTISVGNTNDAPSDILLSSNTVNENATLGSTVGEFTTLDEDVSNTHIYTFASGTGDTDNLKFTIQSSTLITNTSLDYETQSSYSIRVQTNDNKGGTYEEVFTINLLDRNDTPSDITLSANTIVENSASGTVIGTLTSTDDDPSDTHTYTLVDGNNNNNENFIIVGDELRSTIAFNFEATPVQYVYIQTTDASGDSYTKQFVVNVTDANDAPTDLAITGTTVSESATASTLIGSLSTTDADNADTHTYALVTGLGDDDNADFQISGDQLQTLGTFNYENRSSYQIRVETNDGNGGTHEEVIQITITDANDTPTALAINNNSVPENSAIGTTVGVFSTTDEDVSNTFSYSLVSGTGDTDNASFTISGNELLIQTVANFEVQNSYSVRVRTNDGKGGTFEEVFTINITDANDSPTDISLSSQSIAENLAANTLIGTFSTTDIDASDAHTYTFSDVAGNDNLNFVIVGDELRSATTFDYEVDNAYYVYITTNDGNGGTYTEQMAITISDANDTPLDMTMTSQEIDESQTVGTLVGVFATTDLDISDNHSYSLVAGKGDTDNSSFTISNDSLYSAIVFDFNGQAYYSVRVETNDGNGGTYTEIFTTSISDINNDPTSMAITNNEVSEAAEKGTTVGLFSTVDPDENDTHSYNLVTGTGSTDNSAFIIKDNALVTNTTFNFNTKTSYSIRVRSDDGNAGTTEEVFTITITDANNDPSDISLSNAVIDENLPIASVVGILNTTDQDAGDSHTYSFVDAQGNDNVYFVIIGDTIKTRVSFDYESENIFYIYLQSSDGNGGAYTKQFVINISNSNDAPTDLSLSELQIEENLPAGTLVGTLSTFDIDVSDNHTYAFASGSGGKGNSAFTISNDSLYTAIEFNYENNSFYSILVATEDGSGETYTEQFTINVLDENDEPTNIGLNIATIDENSDVNTDIGSFTTDDEDGDDEHVYSLVTDSLDNASFKIYNGILRVNDLYDYETKNSYQILVETNDKRGGIFRETFTITITDANDAPTAIAISVDSIPENMPFGSVVGTFSTTDPDLSNSHIYSFDNSIDNDNESFIIVGDELQVIKTFDYESRTIYYVDVISNDKKGGELSQQFAIFVTDANDAPTALVINNTSVNENLPAGTFVGKFNSTDVDITDNHSYSLISGIGDANNDKFYITNDTLYTAETFRYAEQTLYSIRVQTNDGNGGTYESQFSIEVIDVNDVPTDITISETDVDENSSVGTIIGILSTEDIDLNDDHVYSFVTGTGGDDNIYFQINNNVLSSAASYDFETKDTFNIRIETNDRNGGLYEEAFIITINDKNDAPVDMFLDTAEVAENMPVGTIVGSLSTQDPDTADAHTYRFDNTVADNDNSKFVIVDNVLKTTTEFDYETNSVYYVYVKSNDNRGGEFTKQFTIQVLNTNDAPTSIALSEHTIDEQSPSGTFIGFFSSTDVDVADSHSYSFTSGNGDKDNSLFSISNDSLLINQILYYADRTTYSILVESDDNNGGTLTKQFTINLEDVNDIPTDIYLDQADIGENLEIGTFIGTLSTEDVDNGDVHSYSLVSNGSDDNGFFSISGTKLNSAFTFDYETKDIYVINVASNDNNGGVIEKQFFIDINDRNDAPTNLSIDVLEVYENERVGTVVGTLSTEDVDATDVHTYSFNSTVSDNDNSKFVIVNNELKTATQFDFESKQVYYIYVNTNDNRGGIFTQQFVIDILDTNDAPTDINLTNNSIDEDLPVGSPVGEFSTLDVDASDSHTYTLVTGIGDDNNSSFTISGNTLVSNEIFNYADKGSYRIRVRVTDLAGEYFEESYIIDITDANDNPTQLYLSNTRIFENSEINTEIGTLVVTDEDNDQTFDFVSLNEALAPDNIYFKLDGSKLYSNNIYDYETKASYEIVIEVRDNEGGTYSEAFTIIIEDVNEAPELEAQDFYIDENSDLNTLVGAIIATDVDSNTVLSYNLDNKDDVPFSVDASTGELTISTGDINYEDGSFYDLTVTVKDDGSPALTASNTIRVYINDIVEDFLPVNHAVTPNGDGKNDVFEVRGVDNYQGYSLDIYNDAGECIYHIDEEYQNEWNGNNNEIEQPTGAYYYLFKNEALDKSYSGTITLIR